jgi:pseudouridine-5'-phosphate glycosidase
MKDHNNMRENKFIEYGDEVRDAFTHRKPLVAVETGMLYHQDAFYDNVKNALDCLSQIRKTGAIPAVMAIWQGKLVVGMDDERLVNFLKQDDVVKCNTRDIAVALAQNAAGSTTVSSTAFMAYRAGIPILTAGGIGGVHRNAPVTFDISADLQQLAHTPVAIVSSGAKSILDIPLTLEYLETHGVSVVGYGTHDFPAYYVRKSGYSAEFAVYSPLQVADVLQRKLTLGDKGALLVANPIAEAFELDSEQLDSELQKALEEAEKNRIRGKQITAYLLDRLSGRMEGKISPATRSILLGNAELAARIAVEFSKVSVE